MGRIEEIRGLVAYGLLTPTFRFSRIFLRKSSICFPSCRNAHFAFYLSRALSPPNATIAIRDSIAINTTIPLIITISSVAIAVAVD